MILGLPWTAWILLVVAVGTGLAIELVFYHNHRARPQSSNSREPNNFR